MAEENFDVPFPYNTYAWTEIAKRREAQQVVFSAGVTEPLLLNAYTTMISSAEWSPELTDALASIVRLNVDVAKAADNRNVEVPGPEFLDGLLGIVKGAPADSNQLYNGFQTAYGPGSAPSSQWPPKWMVSHKVAGDLQTTDEVLFPVISKGLQDGLDLYFKNLTTEAYATESKFALIRDLYSKVVAFERAEDRFFVEVIPEISLPSNFPEVSEHYDSLESANAALHDALHLAEQANLFGDGAPTLTGAIDTQTSIVTDALNKEIQRIQSQLQASKSGNEPPIEFVSELESRLNEKRNEVNAWLAEQLPVDIHRNARMLDSQYMLRLGPQHPPLFTERLSNIYEAIKRLRMSDSVAPPRVGTLPQTIEYAQSPLVGLRIRINGLYLISYPEFGRNMLALINGVDDQRDRVLVESYLNALGKELAQHIKFPLAYPAVENALGPLQVVDSMRWINEVESDLKSPNIEDLSRQDAAMLRGILKGLSLVPPMFG
ncbi:MAG: hypothetical protein ACQKBV_07795, partial [Puniceicoccales bacterium]